MRRHRRSLSRGTMERKEWRAVECIGWRGGDRGRGEIGRPKWICAIERQLGAVDERPLLIHLSHIPPLTVQALVSGSSHVVETDEGSSVRQIATEVVNDEEGESEDAEEREGQGADGLDCEGSIRARVVALTARVARDRRISTEILQGERERESGSAYQETRGAKISMITASERPSVRRLRNCGRSEGLVSNLQKQVDPIGRLGSR